MSGKMKPGYDPKASPGILIGPDGRVIFDGEAEAMGAKPFKTKAEIDAHDAELEAALAERAKEKEAEDAEFSRDVSYKKK